MILQGACLGNFNVMRLCVVYTSMCCPLVCVGSSRPNVCACPACKVSAPCSNCACSVGCQLMHMMRRVAEQSTYLFGGNMLLCWCVWLICGGQLVLGCNKMGAFACGHNLFVHVPLCCCCASGCICFFLIVATAAAGCYVVEGCAVCSAFNVPWFCSPCAACDV